jgi:DNA-binding MarR family transcriptional regulator
VIDFTLVLLAVLLTLTIATSFEYYRKICKAQKEYEKAKELVEDIVLSFNRELKRETNRLEQINFKVEGNSAKSQTIFKKIDYLEKKITPLESQLENMAENNKNILLKITSLTTIIEDIGESQEILRSKISNFEGQIQEQIQKFSIPQEIQSEPVITIKRDKAMASLTITEISVLEMLSSEGPKTAPEIKERVQLSREHTARLMKKLYEGGYLERETGRIPFRYSVKKEMEKLLRKTETKQL